MYQPSEVILKKYASVLVNFALNSGEGIRKGEVVSIQGDTSALPLLRTVYAQVLKSGGHPILRLTDESFSKILFENASDTQLQFFPRAYLKSLVDVVDHRIAVLSDVDPMLLRSIPPEKIMLANSHASQIRKWLFAKEDAGKLTWTLALYGTEGMAKEAGLSLDEYWEQIIAACYLDKTDPLKEWKSTFQQLETMRTKLNALPIEKLHIEAEGTNLWIRVGKFRQWLGGSGRNIPSFELFTSPDWRGTEGVITFNYPLYRYGSVIRDIQIKFHKGLVMKISAKQNEELLRELIRQPNANKVGEYSLTDRRFSRISKFMANTLYDENAGGEFGNTHLALGTSYHEAYTKGTKGVRAATWKELGFNESPEHTDIMATTDRTVTAFFHGGQEKVIYQKGQFVL